MNDDRNAVHVDALWWLLNGSGLNARVVSRGDKSRDGTVAEKYELTLADPITHTVRTYNSASREVVLDSLVAFRIERRLSGSAT